MGKITKFGALALAEGHLSGAIHDHESCRRKRADCNETLCLVRSTAVACIACSGFVTDAADIAAIGKFDLAAGFDDQTEILDRSGTT
jgi:hypothetical protein